MTKAIEQNVLTVYNEQTVRNSLVLLTAIQRTLPHYNKTCELKQQCLSTTRAIIVSAIVSNTTVGVNTAKSVMLCGMCILPTQCTCQSMRIAYVVW